MTLAGLLGLTFTLGPWPPLLTLRHMLAAPNCASGRAVSLAPAYRAQPGYYGRHDADADGVACEPYPR